DTIAFQDLGDRRFADALRFGGRGRKFPKVEHGGKVAPKLLAHAVGEPVALVSEFISDPRPLPQFDNSGVSIGEHPEATRIGAQGGGHCLGVTAVILGASHCEAVAKAIHLLGVDGVNLEAALEQCLDHRSMRRLDRNVDLTGIGSTAHFQQPTAQLGEPFASMLEDLLTNFASFAIRQKHMMALARPIDAGVPSLFGHAFSPLENASRRNLCRSLYWRSESKSQVRRGLPTGHRLRPIRQGARPPQVIKSQGAIGCSRQTGSVWEGYADLGRRPLAALRSATLHCAQPAACFPRTA